MSFAIDANVLLYASDENSPKHTHARAFLDRCAAGSEVVCLAWITLLAYLRVSTHPRIFSRPLTQDVAMMNIEGLLALPQVRTLAEEQGFWSHYRFVTRATTVRGNLVPDAHLVALLRQHDVKVLYTSDSDFRKFDDIEVRDPLADVT